MYPKKGTGCFVRLAARYLPSDQVGKQVEFLFTTRSKTARDHIPSEV